MKNRLRTILGGAFISIALMFLWTQFGIGGQGKWEYQAMPRHMDKPVGWVCEELNSYGEQGWEIVGTYTNMAGHDFFLFKRPSPL